LHRVGRDDVDNHAAAFTKTPWRSICRASCRVDRKMPVRSTFITPCQLRERHVDDLGRGAEPAALTATSRRRSARHGLHGLLDGVLGSSRRPAHANAASRAVGQGTCRLQITIDNRDTRALSISRRTAAAPMPKRRR